MISVSNSHTSPGQRPRHEVPPREFGPLTGDGAGRSGEATSVGKLASAINKLPPAVLLGGGAVIGIVLGIALKRGRR